jgi:hypothetical protein
MRHGESNILTLYPTPNATFIARIRYKLLQLATDGTSENFSNICVLRSGGFIADSSAIGIWSFESVLRTWR